VSAFILRELIDQASIEDMVRWSSGPALLAKVGFGKHRGMRWSEVPKDYLHWILKSDMDDRNVRATAKHYLKIAEGTLA
jgi:exodeoxyribonuclease X